MDIKLYYMPGTRAFRVRWLLEELDLKYKLENINLATDQGNTDAYKAVHPLGYLPAIEFDGEAMFESGAICTWLTDKYPEKKLAPDINSIKRREYEQWMYFVPGEVEPPLFYHQLHNRILPEQVQVKEILPWLLERYTHVLKALNNRLENNQYLLGEKFSTADIMLTSTISWIPALLEPYSGLEDYMTRLTSRNAYKIAKQD